MNPLAFGTASLHVCFLRAFAAVLTQLEHDVGCCAQAPLFAMHACMRLVQAVRLHFARLPVLWGCRVPATAAASADVICWLQDDSLPLLFWLHVVGCML